MYLDLILYINANLDGYNYCKASIPTENQRKLKRVIGQEETNDVKDKGVKAKPQRFRNQIKGLPDKAE